MLGWWTSGRGVEDYDLLLVPVMGNPRSLGAQNTGNGEQRRPVRPLVGPDDSSANRTARPTAPLLLPGIGRDPEWKTDPRPGSLGCGTTGRDDGPDDGPDDGEKAGGRETPLHVGGMHQLWLVTRSSLEQWIGRRGGTFLDPACTSGSNAWCVAKVKQIMTRIAMR